MTLAEVLRGAAGYLAGRGIDSARVDAELLLARALGLTRIELYTQHDRPLTEAERAAARALVQRRGRREPLAYVLGDWDFRRLTLKTDARALVPRPETEIVVAMQDERSQLQNRDKAMRVLRARLYEAVRERQAAEQAAARSAQVGTGARAEKIRTYNFPDNRVTDHRIKLTTHRLDQILQGDLEEFTEALQAEDHRRALALASA